MHAKHLTDFHDLRVDASAFGESNQNWSDFMVRLDQRPTGNFGPETIDKLDQCSKIVIHLTP